MSTSHHVLRFVIVCLASLLPGSPLLAAPSLLVDIGAGVGGRADKEPLPQSGWEEWQTPDFNSNGDSASFSFADTTGGTLDVSLATTSGAGARNYGLDGVTDPGNLTVPNVWADLFFFNNNTSGSLTLTLNNLKAGIYEITTYHYADQLSAAVGPNDAGLADISVNGADTGLDATLLMAFDGAEPKTAAELAAGQRTFQFTVSSDGDPVAILFDGLDTNGGGDSFGINGFELSVSGPDETPPTLAVTDPAEDGTEVPTGSSLMATFNEAIELGDNGDVTLKNLTEGTAVVISLGGGDPDGALSVSGSDLTIDPAVDLDPGDEYAVEIGATVVKDLAGNFYAGLLATDTPNWSFTTMVVDSNPPGLLSLSPVDDSTGVPVGTNLVLTFDEPVQKGSGNAVIKASIGGVTVDTIDVSTAAVTVSGAEVTINPPSDLDAETGYYVEMVSGAIEDFVGNPFSGISGSTAWNFTTGTPVSMLLQAQTTTDGSGTALQTGWQIVDGDRSAASISGVVGGVTVTVSGANGAPALGRSAGGDGGGYLNVDHSDGDLDNLLSGGRLTNTGEALTLTLSGLADGDYEIITYHHSPYNGSFDGVFEFDVLLTDANGTNVVVHDNIGNSQGGSVTTAGLAAPVTPFTVSGGNDVILAFAPVSGFDTGGGSDQMYLNGFELADAGPDTTDPVIIALNPADNSEAVLSADLVATFDDAIAPGTGSITIHEAGGAVFESFDVETSPRVTFSGFVQGTLTIDPSNDLAPGAAYYVLIDPTAIDDNAGNSFAGISDPAGWNFTGDGTAPTGIGSPEVSAGGSLTLSFDEEVVKGTGNIVIRRAGGGTVVDTIDVTSASVVVSGATVTIQPGFLDPDTAYYVAIDAGAFVDLSGNAFAGFSAGTDWNFTTPDTSLAGVPPAGGTSLGSAFETWLAQYSGLGTHVGPYHNADGSRFNNFGEFAFDGHPLVQEPEGTSGSLNMVDGEKTLTFTVPVRDGAVFTGGAALVSDIVDGLTYAIEVGRNLSDWDVVPSEITGPDADAIQAGLPALSPGWSYRSFRMPGTTADEAQMFFRARADDLPLRIQQARDSSVIASYALGKVKRWLHEVALPKINSNDLFVAHNGGSARYSSWWNYDDTAADCYPFLFWAAFYTDIDQINTTDGPVHDVLVAEQLHCNLNDHPTLPLGRIPTAVHPDTLVKEVSNYTNTMFAASEYVKDGLIPIVEVMGTGNPWFDRMQGIIDDMWANAQVNTAYGLVPTSGTEANGEQLQALARLYAMTGDSKYLDWGERIADSYLLSGTYVPSSLRDHGCEIIGGLGLFYAVEAVHRPAKAAAYLPGLQYMLDELLERGTNADGIFYNSLGGGGYSDGWGYNYPAFLCHDMVVAPPRYSLGVQQTLRNLAKPVYATAWGGNIDENADSIEGGLYQINRFQVPEAIAWADQEMAAHVTRSQDPNVNTTSLWTTYKLEANGVRTVLQHTMMHTRGLIARPWELDLELGASQTADGVVVTMTSASGWTGILEVDKPRHRLLMGFTRDWPRMNTMPEWFVAEPDRDYVVEDLNTGATATYTGAQLHVGLPVTLVPGVEKLLLIRSAP